MGINDIVFQEKMRPLKGVIAHRRAYEHCRKLDY